MRKAAPASEQHDWRPTGNRWSAKHTRERERAEYRCTQCGEVVLFGTGLDPRLDACPALSEEPTP